MAKGKSRSSYRSAITGRYVTKTTAKRHPKTTVKETNKVKSNKKSGKQLDFQPLEGRAMPLQNVTNQMLEKAG